MKKFLKPTIVKIILTFVILFLISYFSPCYFCSGWSKGCSWHICEDAAFFVLIPGAIVFDANWVMWGVFGIGSWLALPVLFLISYLLSATILVIFKK